MLLIVILSICVMSATGCRSKPVYIRGGLEVVLVKAGETFAAEQDAWVVPDEAMVLLMEEAMLGVQGKLEAGRYELRRVEDVSPQKP